MNMLNNAQKPYWYGRKEKSSSKIKIKEKIKVT
jgi:hypothetical protein